MTDETPGPASRPKPRQPPPPLTRSVHGPLLPHAAVLDELVSPVGVLLWGLLQDATLWGTAEASAREGLFADAARATAGLVPEVEEELDALGVLVRDPHPDAAPLIARMCDRVRAWAEGRGLYGTALAFAQAAALADPADARCAYEVGRLARVRAEYGRAEVWYQRAVVLARRSGDAEAWALGLSGLANLYGQRGNYPIARRLKERVVRLAKRNSLDQVLGGAYHDLAVLDFEAGDVQLGMRNARRALRVLGATHARTPVLIHDMAVALMDQRGAFAVARQVLSAVLPHIVQADMRQLAVSNLGWAAGAMGDRQLFDAVWTEVWAAVEVPSRLACADQLLALARGAAALHEWELSRQAAERALVIAEQRREGRTIHVLESLLAEISLGRPPVPRLQAGAAPPDYPDVTLFAQDLIQAVQWRAPVADRLQEKVQAALAEPADARVAYELGRALRDTGQYEHGAAWLRRGAKLARQAGDPRAEAMCLGGLANLHVKRGDLQLGFEVHQQHLALAREQRLEDMEAFALVDLCAVCFAADRGDAGFAYALEALAVLPPGDPLCARLAHDLAMYLMESRGDFGNALILFRALERFHLAPAAQLIVRASLCRAAAGAGHAQLFEETWAAVWSAVEPLEDSDCPSGAFIQLAQAALHRGHYVLAEDAARRALRAGLAHGEKQVVEGANSLLATIERASATRARLPAERDSRHNVRTAARITRSVAAALRRGAARRSRVARTPSTVASEEGDREP